MARQLNLRNRVVIENEIKKNPNYKNKTKIANELKKYGPIKDGKPATNYVQLRLSATKKTKLYQLLRDVLDDLISSKFKDKICAAYGTLLGLDLF